MLTGDPSADLLLLGSVLYWLFVFVTAALGFWMLLVGIKEEREAGWIWLAMSSLALLVRIAWTSGSN